MLWIDLETYCERPITDGTYAYAEAAEIMLFAWAVDDEPVRVWDCTADALCPAELGAALADPHQVVVAHNAMFDRTVLRFRYPGSCPPIERWRCSMVRAMAHGLPGGLDKLGELFGLAQDERKLKAGRDLLMLFCKPRPKNQKLRRATRATHPVEWARFVEYAGQDIVAMRALWKKLPEWNYTGQELALWHLDQAINDRGVHVDLEFVEAAQREAQRAQAGLKAATIEATDGELASTTQRDKMLAYLLAEYGVELPDLRASTLERRVRDETLPGGLRQLLAIRMEASMTSSSKYGKIARAVNADGRVRGTLQFDGALRTRRWAGRTVQPQNLMRPPEYLEEQLAWEEAVQAIKAGAVDLMYAKPAEVCAATVRAALAAPRGKKLVVADLANIEGRGLAWLAGERWKLQAFREYDAGTGPDLYKLAYARSFGVEHTTVTKHQRQIGKVEELMLGYQGGVGAFITGAATYNIDLDAMAHAVLAVADVETVREAREFLAWSRKSKRSTFGLADDTFVACDTVKRLWRAAHARTESLWHDTEQVVREAIDSPGKTLTIRGAFRASRAGAWLRLVLPSGRALCYPLPRIGERGQISYMGVNQYTKRWARIKTHGGKLIENAVQSLSRDVLAEAMVAVEDAGYPVVLTVHDEILTEVPRTPDYTVERLCALLATNPKWAPDLPLAAAGFETINYRKD